jgi:chromosome partitioning protein
MTIRKQKVWAVVGQKGGDGKSTVAYALSCYLASLGRKTILMDVDRPQFSSVLLGKLGDRQLAFELVRCQNMRDIPKHAQGFEAVVFDGAPHASLDTLTLCKYADCIVIPTRTYTINLKPAFEIAAELTANGVDKRKIIFLISQALSKTEVRDARETIEARGYRVTSEDLRTYAAYGKAGDAGKSVLDVPFKTLRERANCIFSELANA